MAVTKKSKKKSSKSDSSEKVTDKNLDAILKKYGAETIKVGLTGDSNVKRISSGVLGIDRILGLNKDGSGGAPQGRILEFYGPESSGKTALSLYILGQAQKMGLRCAFVDMENTLTEERCIALGVNPETLITILPDYGEQALNLSKDLLVNKAVDFLVVDSVSALVPKAELEGEIGDSQVGTQARMMGQAMRQMCKAIADSGATVIFINQLRKKIGVMFGNPETTSGGEALKFYASVRVDIRRTQKLKDGDEVVGNEVKIKTVKNKTAPAHREGTFRFLFTEGFSVEHDLIQFAVKYGLVDKKGAWFSYKGENVAQGETKFIDYLKKNPSVRKEIDTLVREAINNSLNPSTEEESSEEESPKNEPQSTSKEELWVPML